MMEQKKPIEKHECLMVLGMHRSGGSLLAGCLHHLGVNFGHSLLAGKESSWGDAFENQDIVLAHEILFRDLGGCWDMVGSLPEGWVKSEAAKQTRQKITQIIEKQFLGQGLWAIKDPRLCRVMPLWSEVLARLGIRPFFIHMIRHPHEVASSLKEHHATGLTKGHLLWLVHNRDALKASHGHPHTFLTYDQLVADPVSSMLRISSALNIDLPGDPLQYSRTITDFAQPDLKHHHTSNHPTSFSNQAFTQYAWVYDQFRPIQSLDSGVLSDFPIMAAPDSAPENQVSRSHASEMFNNLLGMIGRYEQAELDHALQRERRLLAATHVAETLYAQIYFPVSGNGEDGYSEENSHKMLLAPNEWHLVTWDISRPEGLRTGRLRLDPLNTRGMVSISGIKLVHAATGEVCWSADESDRFAQCTVAGDALLLSAENGLTLVCTGDDSRFCLPVLPDLPDYPMQLEVWIKASRNQTILNEAWTKFNTEKSALDRNLLESQALLEQARNRASALEDELSEKETTLQAREKESQALLEQARNRASALEDELSEKEATLQARAKEKQDLETLHLEKVEALKSEILEKNQSVTRLEEQFIAQEKLSRQYQASLREAEQECRAQAVARENQALRKQEILATNRQLAHARQQLTGWMEDLKIAIEALAVSRRWKFGCVAGRALEILRMRSKSATAMDQIQGILGQFEHTRQHYDDPKPPQFYTHSHDGPLLFSWMEQLQRDFKAFAGSRRWRLGNTTIRFVEKLFFRPKVLLAPEHMASIFYEFENWKQNNLSGGHGETLSHQEITQIKDWLRKLDHDFQATLVCRRWRLGSAIVQILMCLTFRPRVPIVTDHMQEIFEDFRKKMPLGGGASQPELLLPVEHLPATRPSRPLKKHRNTLNILFVLYESADSNGGLHVQLHASRLAALGVECRLAVPTHKPPVHTDDKLNEQMRSFAQMEKDGPSFTDGRGPDVIHAWTPREIVRVFCQKMLKRYPCPLIIHLEDNESHLTEVAVGMSFAQLEKMPKKDLDKLIPETCYHPINGRSFLASAQGLTLIIETLSPFNYAGVPSMVLSPPVDERIFYPRSLNLALRKELGITNGHLVLAYTGNVHAANRDEVLELYRAVHLLNEQGCPTTLIRTGVNGISLGDEPWINAHEKKLGWVERNRVPDILAAADILVQPGTPGPFNDQRIPSKLPEYFAMGRPVILPRTNLGLKVDHQQNGFVLDNADGESIARAVLEIRKDGGKAGRLAMGAAGFYRSELSGIDLKTLNAFYTRNLSNKKN